MGKRTLIEEKSRTGAGKDVVALGIAVAAVLMFVGTGSGVLPQIVRSWLGNGPGPDAMLTNALLLNIALIIFGWRRYRELLAELEQRRLAEETARMLAETDTLTNCLNRRSITTETDAMLAQSILGQTSTAFLMVDLDNFKQVNDFNGHQIGDQVLKATADRIAAVLPKGSLLARLGGDEFAAVVSYAENFHDRIDVVAERLITEASRPIIIGDHEITITVSVGISSSVNQASQSAGATDAQALMHHADIAMYHAKKQGKNRHFWFERSMENELRFRNELETGIRRGVQQGEFVPYYEQQIDLDTGELVGFEMLARWNSPQLGLVKPDIFIPVAEDMGIICTLSEQLIDIALEDAKQWDPSITLSVNISPVQLRDQWFAQKLLKQLVKHNFPPQRLEIEITESCLHENIALVRTMITSLRNQGVQISLDDFGTGYASLSQLKTLPFDRLKIDRSFVGSLSAESPEAGSQLINAIVSLGDGLRLPITAEGIEDAHILELLREMGPLKGQGYHYGQPETSAQVQQRLTALNRLAGTDASYETPKSAASNASAQGDLTARQAR
ncbi:EAL domain-containing protein [Altererythrobacter confluentis]|uniref:EAL domain-containing protein n=1 Tax=Allopontixanthobacter confluentis TaxID=1849021 RepID=A0A6L7GEH4_9SPHN|nr:EAL domain-containing protein [Allopontixanthobacter confluentis]MXP13836.1 EAL domain-containing protein [Allopontixanthobacter confluentis]